MKITDLKICLQAQCNTSQTFIFKQANVKIIQDKKPQCLKIIEKVAFKIASEASYVYILSGQKLIKSAKNGQFGEVFFNLKFVVKQCYQTSHF